MRKLIYILLLLVLPVFVFAQSNVTHKNVKVTKKSKLVGQVVIGGSSFSSSAILELIASDKGLLIPRMNTAARDGIGSPATGLLIFNTQTAQFEFFDGTWQAIGGGAGHDAVTLSGTPDYITLSGQDIVRGLVNLGTDITGTTTAASISDFDTEVSNNASVSANTAKVTNATHTGDVTGSGALTIANKAVDIVMLADGTDGELITWDASGVAATVSTGTVGQVLTSGGVGVAPTFQAAGGGGDGDGIYDGNGALSGGTTVTMATNNLTFASTGVSTLLKLDAVNDRVEIGIPQSNFSALRDFGIGINRNGESGILISNRDAGTSTAAVINFENVSNGFGQIRLTGANFTGAGGDAANSLLVGGGGSLVAVVLQAPATGGILFKGTSNANIGRWEAGGDLGVGIDNPTARLQSRGVNAASTSDALLIEDNVGTDLFIVENGGHIGVNTSDPTRQIDVLTNGGFNDGAGIRFSNAGGDFFEFGADGGGSMVTPTIKSNNAGENGNGAFYMNDIAIANDVLDPSSFGAAAMFIPRRVGGGAIVNSRLFMVGRGLSARFMIMPDGDMLFHAVDLGGFIGNTTPDFAMDFRLSSNDIFGIRSGNAIADNNIQVSPTLQLIGQYDSDPSSPATVSVDFVSEIQSIVTGAGASPTGRMAFTVEGNEAISIDETGNVGIGTSAPASSAILEVSSTTGAILFPRMNTTERDALTAVDGMVIYNTSLSKLQVRAASAWVSLH